MHAQAAIKSILDEDDGSENKNYYELAHSIGEEIVEQPKMLKGGNLKPYQVRACPLRTFSVSRRRSVFMLLISSILPFSGMEYIIVGLGVCYK